MDESSGDPSFRKKQELSNENGGCGFDEHHPRKWEGDWDENPPKTNPQLTLGTPGLHHPKLLGFACLMATMFPVSVVSR